MACRCTRACDSTPVPTPMRRRIARRARARSWRNAHRSGKAAEPRIAARENNRPIEEVMMASRPTGLREALKPLFQPAHVAVIGASSTPGKHGNVAIRYLQRAGYPGRISPVNSAGGEVEGLACYRSIKDV